jgi:hypothetical protein
MTTTLAILALLLADPTDATTQPTTSAGVVTVGRIASLAIPESSGLATSRRHAGIFWTINDSGSPAALHAIDRAGLARGDVAVAVANVDWEDLHLDEDDRLYVADIGNNDARRTSVAVHRFDEPDPASRSTRPVAPQRSWTLQYAGAPFDAEGFFTWKDRGYVVSKLRSGGRAGVWAFDLEGEATQTLRHVADLPTRFPVTAATISDDGTRVAVATVAGMLVLKLEEPGAIETLGRAAASFVPHVELTMEAVAFVPDGVLATTERREVLLFPWPRFAAPVRP